MRFAKVAILSLVLFFTNILCSQDYHYTQNFNFISLENPAHAGNMDYDHLDKRLRILALYRNQWRSIQSPFINKKTPFETYRFGSDLAFKLSKKHLNYWGLGVNVVKETAGDLGLSNMKMELPLSCNLYLNQEGFDVLSFGIAPSFTQKTIGLENAYYDRQWNGKAFDPSLSGGEPAFGSLISYFDLNSGIMYRNLNKLKRFNFCLGTGVSNLTEPRANFNETLGRLNRRIMVHSSGLYRLKSERNLYFYTHFWNQGQLREFNFLLYKTIGSDALSSSVSYVGASTRVVGGLTKISNDALCLHYIQDYKNYRFSISYDINLTKLNRASSARGAIEISIVNYLLENKFQKKTPKKYNFKNTKCPKHQRAKKPDFD